MNKGKIVQVMGAIVDVKFDKLPKINNALVIEKLQLLYNRARQQSITNDIIDIVSGANAV